MKRDARKTLTLERIDELLRFRSRLAKATGTAQVVTPAAVAEVHSLPYMTYGSDVEQFFEAASQDWWCDYDYSSKDAAAIVNDDRVLASASLEDIKTALTFCVRGERFADGHWADLLDRGRIQAILDRLEVLRPHSDHHD